MHLGLFLFLGAIVLCGAGLPPARETGLVWPRRRSLTQGFVERNVLCRSADRSEHFQSRVIETPTTPLFFLSFLSLRNTHSATMSDFSMETCPSSAAFFGFMGVASSMVFGSECRTLSASVKKMAFEVVWAKEGHGWHRAPCRLARPSLFTVIHHDCGAVSPSP